MASNSATSPVEEELDTAPEGQSGGAASSSERLRFWIPLGVIVAVGLAVRMAFILIRQSRAPTEGDVFWYHFQAKLLANGKGFLNPYEYYDHGVSVAGADHPPGLVVVLAALDKLGLDTPQLQRGAMALLGSFTLVLIAMVGRRFAGPTVGLVAAGLAALYPNLWINDGMLMPETLFVFGIVVSFLFTYRYLDDGGLWNVAGISAGLTVAAMTRPETIVLFVFYLAPLLVFRKRHELRERFVQLGIAAIIPIVAFSPWVIYNLGRFEEPVLLSTGAGQSLVVANCDLTYEGPRLGYWEVYCLLPPHSPPKTEKDASVYDRAMQAQAREYMLDHIEDLPRVVAARIGRMWGLYRPGESVLLDGLGEGRTGGVPGQGLEPVRAALWSYFVLAPLAIVGGVLMRKRQVPIHPFVAQFAMATFTAAITFGITRYRAGAEVAIVLMAAFALVEGWRWFRARSSPDDAPVDAPADAPGDAPVDVPVDYSSSGEVWTSPSAD